jgi:hypothetical protein
MEKFGWEKSENPPYVSYKFSNGDLLLLKTVETSHGYHANKKKKRFMFVYNDSKVSCTSNLSVIINFIIKKLQFITSKKINSILRNQSK